MQASGFCAWGDPIPYACAQTVRDYCPYTEPPYRHTAADQSIFSLPLKGSSPRSLRGGAPHAASRRLVVVGVFLRRVSVEPIQATPVSANKGLGEYISALASGHSPRLIGLDVLILAARSAGRLGTFLAVLAVEGQVNRRIPYRAHKAGAHEKRQQLVDLRGH